MSYMDNPPLSRRYRTRIKRQTCRGRTEAQVDTGTPADCGQMDCHEQHPMGGER